MKYPKNKSVNKNESKIIKMCNQLHKIGCLNLTENALVNNPPAGSTVQVWGAACRDSDIDLPSLGCN